MLLPLGCLPRSHTDCACSSLVWKPPPHGPISSYCCLACPLPSSPSAHPGPRVHPKAPPLPRFHLLCCTRGTKVWHWSNPAFQLICPSGNGWSLKGAVRGKADQPHFPSRQRTLFHSLIVFPQWSWWLRRGDPYRSPCLRKWKRSTWLLRPPTVASAEGQRESSSVLTSVLWAWVVPPCTQSQGALGFVRRLLRSLTLSFTTKRSPQHHFHHFKCNPAFPFDFLFLFGQHLISLFSGSHVGKMETRDLWTLSTSFAPQVGPFTAPLSALWLNHLDVSKPSRL